MIFRITRCFYSMYVPFYSKLSLSVTLFYLYSFCGLCRAMAYWRAEIIKKYSFIQTLLHGRYCSTHFLSVQVLEVLLETCNTFISSDLNDVDFWLQGLERVAKATILGHLLPVLLTAMTDRSLRCLHLADQLMPSLVQLVLLTSQVGVARTVQKAQLSLRFKTPFIQQFFPFEDRPSVAPPFSIYSSPSIL